jgi:hypothetical protein
LKNPSHTFHGRDIFACIAAYLSKGKPARLFGSALDTIKKLKLPQPKLSGEGLLGEIIYVDRFGNLVTNIDEHLFQKFTEGRTFSIKIKNRRLNFIAKSYQAVKAGLLLAIFGSFGFLEISVNGGNAKNYLKAQRGTSIGVS